MKSRPLFVTAAIVGLIGIGLLVAQQHKAQTLASAIVSKDQSGLDTTADQQRLKTYASTHMGATTTVFLQGSYARAAQAAQAATNPASGGQVYAAAQAACAGKSDSIVQARCVTAYVNSHSQPAANPQPVAMPLQADYTKTFTAPTFTFDLAGLLLALCGLLVAAGFIVRRR
jgi:hypothetical protein